MRGPRWWCNRHAGLLRSLGLAITDLRDRGDLSLCDPGDEGLDQSADREVGSILSSGRRLAALNNAARNSWDGNCRDEQRNLDLHLCNERREKREQRVWTFKG